MTRSLPSFSRLSRAVVALGALCFAGTLAAHAEVTRTLRVTLRPSGAFDVENLAGAMRVVAGDGAEVVAVATVHAESQELAGAMRFEEVAGKMGRPTLRVRYPLDRHSTIRYPRGKSAGKVLDWLSFGSSTQTDYDDHRVKVSESQGVLLYADVEVRLPRGRSDATFRNIAGAIHAEAVSGTLGFDTGSGDVTLRGLSGAIVADTGSGDVKATRLDGSFTCDTGSGDCVLEGFSGTTVKCDVGSGDVMLSDVRADRVAVDTGSGDVHLTRADIVELEADTGSGDVDLAASGTRLESVAADTGSGDVTLRLSPDAGFTAHADQGSGDLVVRFPDAQPILERRELVGYRRGNGRIRIDVDTGSGDLVILPGT